MANPVELPVGLSAWPVTIPPEKVVELRRAAVPPSPTASPRELVKAALEAPFGFEPMRRAITPDDHVAIVLDPDLPHPAELLAGVLDHLATAGVAPSAVTIISPPAASQGWIDALPDEYAEVTAETHDPTERKKLAYLASTKADRRVYLNRSLVEAEFVVVLTGRRYDTVTGYAGAELAVYPTLADEDIRTAYAGPFTKSNPWPGTDEAREVAWLLGMPFLVQVIEGPGGTIHDVVAGLLGSEPEGRRRQDARWAGTIGAKADTAVATISGPADRVTFRDLAAAVVTAAGAVVKGGRVVLLTDAAPALTDGVERLRAFDDPKEAWNAIRREKPDDAAACRQWCLATAAVRVCLASGYPDDVAEELFATPIRTPTEAQRLIDAAESVVVIPDAHKMKVTVEHL